MAARNIFNRGERTALPIAQCLVNVHPRYCPKSYRVVGGCEILRFLKSFLLNVFIRGDQRRGHVFDSDKRKKSKKIIAQDD